MPHQWTMLRSLKAYWKKSAPSGRGRRANGRWGRLTASRRLFPADLRDDGQAGAMLRCGLSTDGLDRHLFQLLARKKVITEASHHDERSEQGALQRMRSENRMVNAPLTFGPIL